MVVVSNIKNESTAYYEETLVYLKICSTVQTETVLSICNALRDVCHKLWKMCGTGLYVHFVTLI